MIMTCTNYLVMLICSDDVCLVGIANQNSPEIDGLVAGASSTQRAEIIASVMRLKSSSESEVRSPLAATPAAEDVPPSPDELEVPFPPDPASFRDMLAVKSHVE